MQLALFESRDLLRTGGFKDAEMVRDYSWRRLSSTISDRCISIGSSLVGFGYLRAL